VTWTVVLAMAAGAYFFKALGVFVLGRFADGGASLFSELASLVPAALFAAIVAVQTLETEGAVVFDARIAGVAAGGIAVWRKAPFVVVVAVAMAVAALVRWQTLL